MTFSSLDGKRILVTGAAGFIGGALVARLLGELQRAQIVGFDSVNDYYSVALKEYRLRRLARIAERSQSTWRFVRGSLTDVAALARLFTENDFHIVVHLAAQAGVRYSVERPDKYVESNLVGFCNLIEECRKRVERSQSLDRLIYASSSSVYGNSESTPFSTSARADEPVSFYAATKRANELIAYSYGSLYGLTSIGLRFFTVYGPFGRPDMFYYSATENFVAGRPVSLYRGGACRRDFTYIDDAVEGIVRVMSRERYSRASSIFNLGSGRSVTVKDFVSTLRDALVESGVLARDFDLTAYVRSAPDVSGDVVTTLADVEPFEREFGFRPGVEVGDGLLRFARWYREYKLESSGR